MESGHEDTREMRRRFVNILHKTEKIEERERLIKIKLNLRKKQMA